MNVKLGLSPRRGKLDPAGPATAQLRQPLSLQLTREIGATGRSMVSLSLLAASRLPGITAVTIVGGSHHR